ncbi:hypothetical protein [Pseudonocardia sp. TRM90224]|uniref:hypothetical protein n=1 Tax=Pseudonocardia sp. TRM90224 TaxID=2812678 RepID=UPI001E641FD7|nr:hypothetical protein [Pseudonocardia sp. TRM90224]
MRRYRCCIDVFAQRREGAAWASRSRSQSFRALLGGGDDWDGRIYHYRNYEGRRNAQWKLEPPTTVASPPGVVHFVDRKHGRALVAGDQADGNLYHQPPGDRRNALWSLELASEGTGGPAMYITKQELVDISYAFDQATRLETPPQLVISRTTVGSDVGPQSFVLTPRYSEKVTETVTFQHSATLGLTLSLSLMAGASQLISKTETKFEAKAEFGFSRTSGATTERTVSFAWVVPIRSSGKPVQVEGEMRRARTDVPFESTLRTTYADGSTHDHVEPGTWSNVAYTTGEITYSHPVTGS